MFNTYLIYETICIFLGPSTMEKRWPPTTMIHRDIVLYWHCTCVTLNPVRCLWYVHTIINQAIPAELTTYTCLSCTSARMCDWVTAYSPSLLFSHSSYNWTTRNVLSVLCNSWCVTPFTSPPYQTVPETGWLTVRLLSKLNEVISRYFSTTNTFFCD